MSDYASAAERARRAFASVAKLESALLRAPDDPALQINLASRQKLARQMQDQLQRIAEAEQIELCNYRLLPEATGKYALPYVSKSLLDYQNIFSQVYDAIRNGKKRNATIGKEAWDESLLEFAYSYSGSLGIVLLVPSERDFFEGKFDPSIDAVFQVLDVRDQDDVRDIARTLGQAVVKRVFDWSEGNVKAGFAVDVRWNRSDGRQLGQVVNRGDMEKIVSIISETSDEKSEDRYIDGMLVGIDLMAGTFHFVEPDGDSFRGALAQDFPRSGTVEVGRRYRARMVEAVKITYATEREERKFQLLALESDFLA